MERLKPYDVLTRISTSVAYVMLGFGLSRSVAVPPLDGKCMLGRTCPNSGDLSSVTWPIVSYDNGCELYPTYTEGALKALNERRKMQGLDPVSGEGYRPSAKPGEDGYADPNLPVSKCGAPEVKGYRFIGWYGNDVYAFPLYEKETSSSQLSR